MSGKENKIDGQINVFLALRGHDHQMVDWWQVMREMMEEINHWRMVAKHIAGMCEFGGKGQIDTLRKWRLFLANK